MPGFELFGSVGYAVVGFLFVLTIVVFFHELGHFLVGRWCGVGVKVFSVGFGPELFGYTDRYGTRWKLSVLPLGGYVKFLGDETEAGGTDREALEKMSTAERKNAFASKGVGARAAIVAAGPLANFLLAVVIFTVILSVYGRQITEPRVDGIQAGSAAERAGFVVGDLVESIDGVPIADFSDLQRVVGTNAGNELTVVVDRSGTDVTLLATPDETVSERLGIKQRVGRLGISRDTTGGNVRTETYSVPQAALMAVGKTWFIIEQSLVGIGKLVAGAGSKDDLGGPIKIAQMSGQIAEHGLVPLLEWVALISVSIGLINLFPVPILDGGHLLFYLIEAVRGKPLPDHVQEYGFRMGFAALMLLMLFTIVNDTQQWWG
jgi:regulator of sigma E protease